MVVVDIKVMIRLVLGQDTMDSRIPTRYGFNRLSSTVLPTQPVMGLVYTHEVDV